MSIYFCPSDAVIGVATGADCSRFVQARISNDLSKLAEGEFMFSAALTAQGKIQAIPLILKSSPEELIVLHEGLSFEDLSKVILQFKVADRVEFAEMKDVQLMHVYGAGSEESLGSVFNLSEIDDISFLRSSDSILLRRDRGFGLGFDLVARQAEMSLVKESLDKLGFKNLDSEHQKLARVKAGVLSFSFELEGMFFPESQLNNLMSSTKGCYVGQEAVEMALARGRLPAELRKFTVSASSSLDDFAFEFSTDKRPSITVLSACFDAEQNCMVGIARVRKVDLLEEASVSLSGERVTFDQFDARV